MKAWKLAALIALVAIPLLLVGKRKVEEKGFQPESGDINDIFDRELSAE
jgi:hypothetical protein